jgi:collagenase-like PrtC family protease
MKYFSLPADFKKDTIDRYDELNRAYQDSKVKETYGNITTGLSLGSGRSVDLLPYIDLDDLQEYVEYSKERNIDFNYTINGTHMNNREFTQSGILEIVSFLKKIYKAGVRNVTVTLPSMIELIRSSGFDFRIKASTICQITNPQKALAFKRMGVHRIVPDESLNRDLKTLKRVRDCFGEEVEILINTICYKNCSYRMFHYNQVTSDSIKVTTEASANYYSHRCVLQRYDRLSNLLRLSWVRPEDLKYYMAIGVNKFKIQGRQTVIKGDPVRAIEYYFKESYDGDLMELLDLFDPTNSFRVQVDNRSLDGFLKPFAEKENFCKDDCDVCNYCEAFSKKVLSREKAKEVADNARNFYEDFDQFSEMIKSLKNKAGNDDSEKEKLDAEFDL